MLLRCQAGDERAFAQVIQRFAPRTIGYLRALVGDDADDVQQEVWLTVFRSLHELANPGAFRTWLFRLTRHRAIDWLRRRKRERELLDEAALEIGDAHEETSMEHNVDEVEIHEHRTEITPGQGLGNDRRREAS